MVSLTTAEKALKDYYLGVVAEQLNTGVNPFLAKIAQTSADVWGKQIVKMVPYGVNGGVGAGTETGALPTAAGNNYERFTLDLKNLYGRIEISDKAMRASLSTEGAFVNLLNAEMEGLLKASKFNLGRMLFGDGSGKLATLSAATASATKTLTVDDTRNLTEGMVVDIVSAEGTPKSGMTGLRITAVDRTGKSVTFDKGVTGSIVATDFLTVQGSYKNEITGLKAIFAASGTLYGLNKSDYKWLTPKTHTVSALTLEKMQEAIDDIDIMTGGKVDMILCSYDMRREYIDLCSQLRMNVDYMELDGGYKTVSYCGIPVVADRFAEAGSMYLLNSGDFKLHQLGDWRWIEGNEGKVLHQNADTATYHATLVKYADMICDRPLGQALIKVSAGS